jgi:MYXO-CTERM domain-containing protein
VIANQPYDAPHSITSQHTPDDPSFTAIAFDDFTLDATTDLSALTVYGHDAGEASYNTHVVMQIRTSAFIGADVLFEGFGTQDGLDLVFNLTGIQLEAGHYWLSAFVVQPYIDTPGWSWGQSLTTNGEKAMWQNPGNGYGLGSAPLVIANIGGDYDMAFTLEGTATPAPGALALLGAVGLLGSRRRR